MLNVNYISMKLEEKEVIIKLKNTGIKEKFAK